MPVGTMVGLGTGHIVSDGDPAPQKGGTAHNLRPMSIVAKQSPITATAEHFRVDSKLTNDTPDCALSTWSFNCFPE